MDTEVNNNPVYITFEAPEGFRVPGEGDLPGLWSKETRAKKAGPGMLSRLLSPQRNVQPTGVYDEQ